MGGATDYWLTSHKLSIKIKMYERLENKPRKHKSKHFTNLLKILYF